MQLIVFDVVLLLVTVSQYVDFGWHIRIGARTFVNVGLVALDVAAIAVRIDSNTLASARASRRRSARRG